MLHVISVFFSLCKLSSGLPLFSEKRMETWMSPVIQRQSWKSRRNS